MCFRQGSRRRSGRNFPNPFRPWFPNGFLDGETARAVEAVEREFAADVAGLAPPAAADAEQAGASDDGEPPEEVK